ncbi:hypothetical protein FOPE_11314 [Fonsecaea pedrosoi]|nr:hypothetical protein FOPE_11314 [Fonsecaea pedrosoi]
MALDQFRVDWDPNSLQTFFNDADQRDAVPESPTLHFFNWKETDSSGRTRSIGSRFRHLFFSSLDIPDEHEWHFERPLGKGSFGAAALYTKRNARQEKTDAFVLKVADVEPRIFLPANGRKINLTDEAAIMAQTNDLGSDNLVRLRQYKVDQQYCRYYLEFCEFGTLETLRLRYKAWNRYLPEPFLWHTFYFLANAYLDLCTGPYRSLKFWNFGQAHPGQYLLHNDLKTDNIFLANHTNRDEGAIWYPVPKIGDFGLATTTNPDELTTNTAAALQRGTEVWAPPELRIRLMQRGVRYHFEEDVNTQFLIDGNVSLHRIRPEANIWAIGAVMWTLMTMEEIDELSERVDDILLSQGRAWRAFDRVNVVGSVGPEITSRYSPQLIALIRECTRLRPGDRPQPDRLVEDIFENLVRCFEREQEVFLRTGDPTRLKVAFGHDDINDLADGGARFPKQPIFWDDFADHLLWSPKDVDLVCPPSAPEYLPFDDQWPAPLRKRFNDRWSRAVQKRDRRAAAENAQAAQAATTSLPPAVTTTFGQHQYQHQHQQPAASSQPLPNQQGSPDRTTHFHHKR